VDLGIRVLYNHSRGKGLKVVVSEPKRMVRAAPQSENREQRPLGPNTRNVCGMTTFACMMRYLVLKTLILVQVIGLSLCEDRASHQDIDAANLGAVPDMVQASFSGAKVDQTNPAHMPIHILPKLALDAMA